MVFNERFWGNGLVYSQNIRPLLELRRESPRTAVELVALVSLVDLLRCWRAVQSSRVELKRASIRVRIWPLAVLPSRLFYPRWFILPLLLASALPCVIWCAVSDVLTRGRNVIYHLRSYEVAIAFVLFYFGAGRLVFDPRTDRLRELTGIEVFREGSWSWRLYLWLEGRVLRGANASVFCSEPMRDEILARHGIRLAAQRHVLVYNCVDVGHFAAVRGEFRKDVLYTGSLGNWNSLRTYLRFFDGLSKRLPDAIFHIVTATRRANIDRVVREAEFSGIRDRIAVWCDPGYDVLPEIYARCRFGLQLMDREDSRLSVKFVEYLAAGVLPIVTETVRGAVAFVERHGVGVVVRAGESPAHMQFVDRLEREFDEFQRRRSAVQCLIDDRATGRRLLGVYARCTCDRV